MQQGTQEWHDWRRKGIGASEASAIMGRCPYSTPYSVFMDKTGRAKAFEGNFATMRGSELEEKIRSRYELISMETMEPACAVHPKYEILRASLDGLRSDGKLILEIKVASAETLEMAKNGVVPDHYMIQIQMQLLVTGADKCHFFVYNEKLGDDALVEVAPNLELQAKIVVSCLEFWENHILKDIAPDLTEKDVKIITDNPDIVSLCKKIADEKDKLKKNELDALKAAAVMLSGHNKFKCGNVQISAVNRNGKFSYHKLTISEPDAENDQVG
jgi:putative phage-type endonuclease